MIPRTLVQSHTCPCIKWVILEAQWLWLTTALTSKSSPGRVRTLLSEDLTASLVKTVQVCAQKNELSSMSMRIKRLNDL